MVKPSLGPVTDWTNQRWSNRSNQPYQIWLDKDNHHFHDSYRIKRYESSVIGFSQYLFVSIEVNDTQIIWISFTSGYHMIAHDFSGQDHFDRISEVPYDSRIRIFGRISSDTSCKRLVECGMAFQYIKTILTEWIKDQTFYFVWF